MRHDQKRMVGIKIKKPNNKSMIILKYNPQMQEINISNTNPNSLLAETHKPHTHHKCFNQAIIQPKIQHIHYCAEKFLILFLVHTC